MKNIINDKKIRELKVINVVRKIIVIPLAIIQILISYPFFIVIMLLFGLTKANNYMDNIALNWMKLFSNYI